MITTRDIARAAGVSHPTVSSVLNDRWRERRIHSHTKDRVLAAARQLGYRPNRLARGLKLRKTNTIGLAIRTMEHPHQAYINERIVLLLEAQKLEVLVTVVPDMIHTHEIEEMYYSHYPEGLIVGPLYVSGAQPFYRKLAEDGFPLVGYHGGPAFPGDQVTHEMNDVLQLAARHLRELGHTRIGRVAAAPDPPCDTLFRERTNGGETHYLYGSLENGHQFALSLRVGGEQPTAYVLEDPLLAIGFLRGMTERGIAVPGDVAFVTCSLGKLGRYLQTTLTTVYPDLDELAEKIVGLMLGRIRRELPSEKQCIWLAPRLTVGESTVKRTPQISDAELNINKRRN